MQVDLAKFQDEVRAFADLQALLSPEQRYEALGTFDPYPEIPSSLLNSGHLASYAITTGMIDPFDIEALKKPASYLVPIEGPVTYLDENGNRCAFFLSKEKSVDGEKDVRRDFELKPNSICYVTLKPKFRIPAYLAGRFNLLIRDVYRGLLVGTGPLVDPGFEGLLSIPVHNFTSNKYTLRAGEGFVYFEFSKLSWTNAEGLQNPPWVHPPLSVQPPFPVQKNNRRVLDDYIFEATGGGPAQNAIQQDIKKITELEEKAEARIKLITVGSIASAVIFLLTTLAVILAAGQLYLGAQQFTQAAQKDVLDSHEKISMELRSLRNELDELKRAPKSIAPLFRPQR